jgi:hypothetical protein
MLAPNRRSLYVESLLPPLGFELRDAIATSYSVSLDSLLGVPVHLALAERSIPKELDAAALAILAALRRLAGRITVFAQSGLVAPPAQPHVLYSLLEPILVEVRRAGGAFHAKIWVLRFDAPDGESRIRLIVPTRNLTNDRCWDASLVLEGTVSGGPKAVNAPLAKLVAALPTFALKAPSETALARVASMVEDLRRTEWEAPPGWDIVGFHVHGLGRSAFPIEPSDELLVISPFVSAKALDALAGSTKNARALVTRPEELAKLPAGKREAFGSLLVLAENAGADPDGEDELESRLRGLHAKVYVATTRSTTDMWIGSANATSPGLVDGRNVEILVQLRTKGRGIRPIDDFLGDEGMGPLLEPFDPATEAPIESPSKEIIEAAQEALSTANLHLRAHHAEELWHLALETDEPLALSHEVRATVWPISMAHTSAVDVAPLREGVAVALPAGDLASLTGLVAFEVRHGDLAVRFVRNLPVEDMPAARDAELLRSVIDSRDRFLALMLALFGDGGLVLRGNGGTAGIQFGGASSSSADGAGLLEHLVRACASDGSRLREAVSLVESLRGSAKGAALVPEGLPELLALFEEVSR